MDRTEEIARPAATVALLRDTRGGEVEVYLQRRHGTMAFGGAWVFPGGTIDQADRSPVLDGYWSGPDPVAWAERLGVEVAEARGAVAAACRETLEEAGVFLTDPPVAGEVAAAARQELLVRRQLSTVLADTGARLATGRLRYWAWWATPEAEARRFDTRFFVAAADRTTSAALHDAEADGHRWLPVRAAAADQSLPMAPPTRHTCETLVGYATVAEVLAAGETRVVERILPVRVGDAVLLPGGERVTLHPGVTMKLREEDT
jgi:8-oxo-dGTP pyrophosphatase MutT (NUDIX family)